MKLFMWGLTAYALFVSALSKQYETVSSVGKIESNVIYNGLRRYNVDKEILQ